MNNMFVTWSERFASHSMNAIKMWRRVKNCQMQSFGKFMRAVLVAETTTPTPPASFPHCVCPLGLVCFCIFSLNPSFTQHRLRLYELHLKECYCTSLWCVNHMVQFGIALSVDL